MVARMRMAALVLLVGTSGILPLLAVGWAPAEAATPDVTVTLAAVADTYVDAVSPDSSFGSGSKLRVSHARDRGLVRFDVGASVPAGATVTGAHLNLYALTSASAGHLDVHPATGSWSEKTTWQDQPTWDTSVVASSQTPTAGTWLSVPLPVASISSTRVSWGLAFSVRSKIIAMASREDPAHSPTLVVTYASASAGPIVTTGTATGVTSSAATLNGTVDPRGATATCYFTYGTSTAYGSRTPSQTVGAAAGAQPTSATATGLKTGTGYHFRAVCTTAAGTASGGDATFTTAAVTPPSSKITKLLTVVEENHSLAQMRSGMPYLYSLAQRYAYATHYTGITHPSLPNYLAIAGGDTFGVTDDAAPSAHVLTGHSVFGQAVAAGRTAATYAESMPGTCALSSSGKYAVKHNPWAYFAGERTPCGRFDVPETGFAAAATADALPTAGMLVPNLCNDAHDCSLATADSWLSSRLPAVLRSSDFTSGRLVVVVTADEDDGHASNTVLTVVLHAGLDGAHKVVSTPLNHYSLSRLYSQVSGTTPLRRAATAADLAAAFALPVG